MLDSNFATAVVKAAAPDERTLVLEVGPGTGCLTRTLLEAHTSTRVLAIEIDRGLAQFLRDELAEFTAAGRFTLIEGDILADKHTISPQFLDIAREISLRENRPRRVLCANLPYNIATPLLLNAAADVERSIEQAVVTVQLETSERLVAQPGENAYGAISVMMALRAQCRVLRRVGKEIFWPRPDVESAVVRLDFMEWGNSRTLGAPMRADEIGAFQIFLKKLFSQRRKMLRAVLKPLEIPSQLNLHATSRAEALTPKEILALFRALQQQHGQP